MTIVRVIATIALVLGSVLNAWADALGPQTL